MEILNQAIFIADAHENEERRGFWEFLQALKKREILTPQLFLMGDIFDLLVAEISATHSFAKPYIELLEELAEEIEIFYFEGNHDFNLSVFFNKVKVFNIKKQPLVLHTSKDKKCEFYLAHGDIFLNPFLEFALGLLRNHYLLCFLNALNFISFNAISKNILKKQKQKKIFVKMENFEFLARKRYEKFEAKGAWVVEGHYHQNFFLNEQNIKYFNLASFAYEKSFFVVEFGQEIKFLQCKL